MTFPSAILNSVVLTRRQQTHSHNPATLCAFPRELKHEKHRNKSIKWITAISFLPTFKIVWTNQNISPNIDNGEEVSAIYQIQPKEDCITKTKPSR